MECDTLTFLLLYSNFPPIFLTPFFGSAVSHPRTLKRQAILSQKGTRWTLLVKDGLPSWKTPS
jgi:hypothetical protein